MRRLVVGRIRRKQRENAYHSLYIPCRIKTRSIVQVAAEVCIETLKVTFLFFCCVDFEKSANTNFEVKIDWPASCWRQSFPGSERLDVIMCVEIYVVACLTGSDMILSKSRHIRMSHHVLLIIFLAFGPYTWT